MSDSTPEKQVYVDRPQGPIPVMPLYPAGRGPLPPGFSEADRENILYAQKIERWTTMGYESCVFKAVMSGVLGLGAGAFLSLMSSGFAYEDPLLRANSMAAANAAGRNVTQKASDVAKEMGRGMWSTGKGFGKVGLIYAGVECAIESYRARDDMWNHISAGFLSGAILARNSGPKAMVGGGLAFAAFSTAIETYMRREPADDD